MGMTARNVAPSKYRKARMNPMKPLPRCRAQSWGLALPLPTLQLPLNGLADELGHALLTHQLTDSFPDLLREADLRSFVSEWWPAQNFLLINDTVY